MVEQAKPQPAGGQRPELSVNLMPDASVDIVAGLAQYAESLGYSRCWVYDEGLVTRDVYVALTAVALRTETMALGPGITNAFVRHPGATASAIASLDELSGGRAFIGLGAGGALTLDPLAIQRLKPVSEVEAMIGALRSLFAGQRVNAQAATFGFNNASLSFGRADIPIILAGRGPRMTALGGAAADGFYLSYIHKDLLGAHVAALRAASTGRPFRLVYSTMIATTETELQQAKASLTFRLVDSPPEVKEKLGIDSKAVDALRSALGEGGPAAAAPLIKDEWVADFVIAGTEAECSAELQALLNQHGIDEFQLAIQRTKGAEALIERTASLFD